MSQDEIPPTNERTDAKLDVTAAGDAASSSVEPSNAESSNAESSNAAETKDTEPRFTESAAAETATPDDTSDVQLAQGVVDDVASIQYLRAYSQFFDSPLWGQNLLFATVCNLIPILGYMLLCGYGYEIVEALHRKPRWTYPPFDFDRFNDYLARGVWPGLIVVVLTMLVSPVLLMAFYMLMFLMLFAAMSMSGSGAGESYAGIVAGIVIPLLLLLASFVSFLALLLIRTVMLGAGVSQDLTAGFRATWIKGFLSRVWVELVLVTLFQLVTLLVLCAIGNLLLIVGSFPAITLWMLAGAHLDYQLYQLYLARGGKPLPLKPPPRRYAKAWLSPG